MSATAVTLIAAGMNAGTQMAQMRAQQRAYAAEARALEENAARAREDAAREEGDQRRHNRQVLGRQRALFAKSGVKLEGTPLLVQEETAREGELDALSIRRSGELRAGGFHDRAGLARLQGRSARAADMFGLGRTILTTKW